METSSRQFGLSAALATPFNAKGEIADARLLSHAELCLAEGCDSVTLFGTTGEGASIGREERQRVLDLFQASGLTGEQLLVGISATSAPDARAQIKAALMAGARRVLLPPPFYFKEPAEAGVEAWYETVIGPFETEQLDIILYNIPALTAVPLSIELIGRLRRSFGRQIAGVKDSSGDWPYTQRLLAAHGDLAILVGEERHLAAAVRAGGQGTICGMANLHPAALRRLTHDGEEDRFVNNLLDTLEAYPLIPALKYLMSAQKGEPDWNAVRAPLMALDEQDALRLKQDYDRLTRERAA